MKLTLLTLLIAMSPFCGTTRCQTCPTMTAIQVLDDQSMTIADKMAHLNRIVIMPGDSTGEFMVSDFYYPQGYGDRSAILPDTIFRDSKGAIGFRDSLILPPGCSETNNAGFGYLGDSFWVRGGTRMYIKDQNQVTLSTINGPRYVVSSDHPLLEHMDLSPPTPSNISVLNFDNFHVFSLEITGAIEEFPKITDVDLMEEINELEHVTDDYDTTSHPMVVLRRGRAFDITVTLDKHIVLKGNSLFLKLDPIRAGNDNQFAFLINAAQDPGDAPADTPLMYPDPHSHVMRIIDQSQNPDGTTTARLRIFLESPIVIGEYKLQLFTPSMASYWSFDEIHGLPSDAYIADETVAIIFNPWLQDYPTPVYGHEGLDGDEASINQFVLSQDAPMFASENAYAKFLNNKNEIYEFKADQFADNILNEAFDALHASQLGTSGPDAVAQVLAEHSNAKNGGMLTGRWFVDGDPIPVWEEKAPKEWLSTKEVVDAYRAEGGPIGSGQCMTYAGVTTGLLRSVGLAARPVWCLRAGIEADNSLDYTLTREKDLVSSLVIGGPDGNWDFHNWTEVWLQNGFVEEPSTPGGELLRVVRGWHAIDSTRNEYGAAIGGIDESYFGQSAVESIQLRLGRVFDFDTEYFGATANGILYTYLINAQGQAVGFDIDTEFIGKKIFVVTAQSGSTTGGRKFTLTDRKPDYKAAIQIPPPCELCTAVSLETTPTVGVLNRAEVIVTNSTNATKQVYCTVNVSTQLNGGQLIEEFVGERFGPYTLAPGESQYINEFITPSLTAYQTHWSPSVVLSVISHSYDAQGNIEHLENIDSSYSFDVPGLSCISSPSGPVPPDTTSNFVYRVQNIFTEPLVSPKLVVNSISEDITVNGSQSVTIALADILPGQFEDVSISVVGTSDVESQITAQVISPTAYLTGVMRDLEIGYCPADVNLDGQVNGQDFTAWIIAFNNGLPMCDQNDDGLCNGQDFTAWIGNFNAGC